MMIMLLSAMGFVFLSLLAISGLLIGVGLNFVHLITPSQEQSKARVLLDAAWLGFGATLAFAQLWHFFRPVNGVVLFVLALLSLVGYATTWKKVRTYKDDLVVGWPFFLSLLIGLFFTGILLNQAIGYIGHWDTGLYHWANMMWNQAYAVVPGLGNLHGRLAFNSNYFFFPALLNIGIWYQRVFHVASASLYFIFSLEVFRSLYHALTPSKKTYTADVLLLLALCYLFVQARFSPSFATDDPVFFLQIVVVAKYLYFLEEENFAAAQILPLLFFTLFVSAVCVTIKLSSAFLLFFIICGLLITLKRRYAHFQHWRQIVVYAVVGFVVVLAPWMIHGYILSGYPLYPSTMGGIPVDWQIPEGTAVGTALWIRSFARNPAKGLQEVMADMQWLGPWLKNMAARIEIVNLAFYVVLAGAGMLYMAVRRLFCKSYLVDYAKYLWPGFLAMLLWFWYAPDPRFGFTSLLVVFGGLLALVIKQAVNNNRWILLLLTLVLVGASVSFYTRRPDIYEKPGDDYGLYPFKLKAFTSYETASGLTVIVPEEGKCFDAEMMVCTPDFNNNLRLRDPAVGLQAGFSVQVPEQN